MQFAAAIAAATLIGSVLGAGRASADPLTCNLSEYTAAAGLTATCTTTEITLTWSGQKTDQLRMRLAINGGTPTIADLAIRKPGGAWTSIATNLTPEYRVASGWRRL